MSTIYLATSKGATSSSNEKSKYVIIINGKVKILNNKEFKKNINSYSSVNLIFQIGQSQAKDLKEHIESKIDLFKEDSPLKFIELLADKFDIHEEQENHIAFTVQQPDEEEKELLSAIQSTQSTPTFPRPNSVRFENQSADFPELRRTLSHHDLPGVDSAEISSSVSSTANSSQNSIHSQDSEEQAPLIASTQKISSFFTEAKHSNNLAKMKRHGNKIEHGYFNGNEKSKILLDITRMAAEVKEDINTIGSLSSNEKINSFKQKISELNEKINDEQTIKTLSRYRGFSPFKCFASLWGGGKVSSINYVNQLRNELNPLINEVLSIRPTA